MPNKPFSNLFWFRTPKEGWGGGGIYARCARAKKEGNVVEAQASVEPRVTRSQGRNIR
jgi:hypothetical protein